MGSSLKWIAVFFCFCFFWWYRGFGNSQVTHNMATLQGILKGKKNRETNNCDVLSYWDTVLLLMHSEKIYILGDYYRLKKWHLVTGHGWSWLECFFTRWAKLKTVFTCFMITCCMVKQLDKHSWFCSILFSYLSHLSTNNELSFLVCSRSWHNIFPITNWSFIPVHLELSDSKTAKISFQV